MSALLTLAGGSGGATLIFLVCLALRGLRIARALIAARIMASMLLIPSVMVAASPSLLPDGMITGALLRGACLVPMIVLLPLRALSALPRDMTRTARGLGAGQAARLRMLWLPLLGPAVLAAMALAMAATILLALYGGSRGRPLVFSATTQSHMIVDHDRYSSILADSAPGRNDGRGMGSAV